MKSTLNFSLLLAAALAVNPAFAAEGKWTEGFEKSNAAKVLPVYGKNFPCNIG